MTSPQFQPGDLVLLTGKGCDRPVAETQAVWTVVKFRGNQAIIRFDPEMQVVKNLEVSGFRNFPASWLVLYRPAGVPVEDEEDNEDF
jgi:hypothetical protein